MVQRRSRFGKTFFSCSNYPDCDVIVNDIDKLNEKYPDHPKTPYVKKAKKGRFGAKAEKVEKKKGKKGKKEKAAKPKKASKQPAHPLSPALAAVVGTDTLSRPEVVKKVWEYIKAHECQDSKNKRLIVPDAKLAKVFGSKEPVDMMKLSGLLNKHIQK
jgi:DNA topoisomerase-1